MSTMPVVWCSDPNSTSKKLTAFTLQGIQLQGNFTEKHVLALQELVNAASEGRLLIPSDGAIFLLDCGISIGSAIVQSQEPSPTNSDPIEPENYTETTKSFSPQPIEQAAVTNESNNCITIDNLFRTKPFANKNFATEEPPDEPKYSMMDAAAAMPNKYEELYEFLCCAKCMNDSAQRLTQPCVNRKSKPRLTLDHVTYITSRYLRKCSPLRPQRKVAKNYSFKKTKLPIRHHQKLLADIIPLYATINKIRNETVADTADMNLKSDCVLNLHSTDNFKDYNVTLSSSQTENTKYYLTQDNESLRRETPTTCSKGDTNNISLHLNNSNCKKASNNNKVSMSSSAKINDTRPSLTDVVLADVFAEQQPFEPNSLLMDVSSNSSSRKTSFDSSCTISSMDSGFIEMQNKLDSALLMTATNEEKNKCKDDDNVAAVANELPSINANDSNDKQQIFEVPPIIVTDVEDDTFPDRNTVSLVQNISVKECLALQSRNRRKSYEEFKALFHPSNCNQHTEHTRVHQLIVANDKVKSRRKSYEEFKKLVKECDTSTDDNCPLVGQHHKLQRKNSKRHCNKSQNLQLHGKTDSSPSSTLICNNMIKPDKIFEEEKVSQATTETSSTVCGTIYDILQRKVSTTSTATPSGTIDGTAEATQQPEQTIVKSNSKKIYDKLLSYGTIYDLVQKKNDICAYQKYDQYMTYGTIYEILQRKSEDYEVFQRKRALSEKFIKRGLPKLYSTTTKYSTLNFGTIYDIIQRKQITDTSDPFVTAGKTLKNRFSVKKVSEDALAISADASVDSAIATIKSEDTPDGLKVNATAYSEPKSPKVKKQTRMRRFSNILSYTPKSNSDNKARKLSLENIPPPIIESVGDDNRIVEDEQRRADIKNLEDLYSRINKLTNNGEMFNLSSLDMFSSSSTEKTTVVTEEPAPRVHARKIGVQHNHKVDLQPLQANNSRGKFVQCESDRKISISIRKALWRKDKSRRLSEFTRGEFLNEKS